MQPRTHPAIVGQHYRMLELKSRVESASPHGLVGLLYEELLRSIDLAILATDKGAPAGERIAKASSILVALEASLDFDQGGPLAVNLANVYRACREALGAAAKTGDSGRLSEIREAVSNISYAWMSLATN